MKKLIIVFLLNLIFYLLAGCRENKNEIVNINNDASIQKDITNATENNNEFEGVSVSGIDIDQEEYDKLVTIAKNLKINKEMFIESFFRKITLPNNIMDKTFIVELKNKKISGLWIHGYRIKSLVDINELINLEKLVLRRCDIERIYIMDKLKNLTYLDLSKNYIDKIEGLDNLSNLQELNLGWNRLSRIEGLQNLSKLLVLNLEKNYIRKIEGLDKHYNLKELYLYYNKINKIDGLNKLSNLETLNLNNNIIEKIEGLGELKKLIFLSLSLNQIEKLEGLDNLKNLEVLFISHNKIKSIMNELPLILKKLPKLKAIDLYNPINIEERDSLLSFQEEQKKEGVQLRVKGRDAINYKSWAIEVIH